MRRIASGVICTVTAFLTVSSSSLAVDPLPGRVSTWHGFSRHDFDHEGRPAIVVAPKKAAPGRPWIWRARFFGHEPQVDRALLTRGYHVAYCDVAGLFGSPRAVARWDSFHELLTKKHGLATKVALEGMSRGGLIIYNWASSNPDKVACLYGDAPVCDIRSWPGGKGVGKGSVGSWKRCLAAYGLTEDEALDFEGNPVDGLASLAKAGVHLLHVFGDADRVVPPAENTAIIAERYRELGGVIHVVSKKGVGHHPHSLREPRPIVSFVVGRYRAVGADLTGEDLSGGDPYKGNIALRGGLDRSRAVFSGSKKGHVAFVGGSITEMNGYRPIVEMMLARRFPGTHLTFTNAGVASTCSTTGAFRIGADVLAKGPADLVLIEFAVNDDQDAGHAARECRRGMEGLIRRIRRHNPRADVVFVHFINPGMLAALKRGEMPATIANHEVVAAHYGVPSLNLARLVCDRVLGGGLTWKEYGGTHPKRAGNELCASMVSSLLDRAWRGPPVAAPEAHTMPSPLDALHYGHGRFVATSEVRLGAGWRLEAPDWAGIPGSLRGRFRGEKLLCATEPGAELTLTFRGSSVGAYLLAGPDAGALEAVVDGGTPAEVQLWHRFSRGLHYPRTVMLATDLPSGDHALKLRVGTTTRSGKHAVRILRLVVNETP